MTWLRNKTIPGFAPRGDEVIGNTRQGQPVTISQEFWRWLSLLATRLQNNVVAAGTIQMTAAATEPEGWLFLNGQTLDASLYPALAEIFGSTAGIITLPDYSDRIPMGAGSIVDLNSTAGAETVALTRDEMPKHNHGVSDPGHLHGAIDRGHSHDLQLDSHTHEASETEGSEHTHSITQNTHTHGGGASYNGSQILAAGSDFTRTVVSSTGAASADITVDAATNPLDITIDPAEVSGTAAKSQANICIHKAKTGIKTLDDGEGQPFSIIPPVFGVNWMVKS